MDAPCQDKVVDGNIVQLSLVNYTYNSTGHITQTQRWVSGTAYLTSTASYAANGALQYVADVNNAVTHYDNGGYACNSLLPLTVTYPITAVGSSTLSWDCNGGVVSSITDPNSGITHYYYDLMYRPSSVSLPNSGGNSTTYNVPNGGGWNTVRTVNLDSSGHTAVDTSYLDGIGRITRVKTTDPQGDVFVDTTYDSLGRVASVSNPYRTTSNGTTQYQYDVLGRETQITHPDMSYSSFSYTNRASKTTSERGVVTIQQSDVAGRVTSGCNVTSVTQANGATPAPCNQDIAGTGFPTSFSYDGLDRLTQVSETGLNNRTYIYDGMSRITQETVPEAGTTTYTYDAAGQQPDMQTRTRPKQNQTGTATVVTTYTHDTMHRLTSASYNDSLTPTLTFNYNETSHYGHTITNPKGRLTSALAGTNVGSVYSYDIGGGVTNDWQCTPKNCGTGSFALTYTRNYIEVPTSMAESGTSITSKTFTFNLDTIGRLSSLQSSQVDSQHPGTLFTINSYNQWGHIGQATFGNGIVRNTSYDANGRLYSLQDGSAYNFQLTFFPDSKIQVANDSTNGNWTYTYDDFNRLASNTCSTTAPATCPDGVSGTNAQGFTHTYDQFGNRWHQNLIYGTGTQFSYQFDANNRITPAGCGAAAFCYDAAGNMTNDAVHAYTFDAEGRVLKVDNGSTATYTYDALGRRVRTVAGSTTFDYVFNQDSKPVIRINGSSTTNENLFAGMLHIGTYGSGTTYFSHTDWQKTERVHSNVSGGVVGSCVNVAFGDGQTCTGTNSGFLNFTGLWFDSYANLTHADARDESGTQGRWLTADPGRQGQNLYTYANNDPINLTDPTGLWGGGEYSDYPQDYWDAPPPIFLDSARLDARYSGDTFDRGRIPEPGSGLPELASILPGEDRLDWPIGQNPTDVLRQVLSGNYSAFGIPTLAELMERSVIMDAGPANNCTPGTKGCFNVPQLCANVPNSPPGASATFTGSLVNLETQGMWPATKMDFFYQAFKTGGPFDYKATTGDNQYVDYGNWNFGYVCGANYPGVFCQSAAGGYRMYRAAMQGTNPFGSGFPLLKSPYGDQAADNQQIRNGIQAQASGCVQ